MLNAALSVFVWILAELVEVIPMSVIYILHNITVISQIQYMQSVLKVSYVTYSFTGGFSTHRFDGSFNVTHRRKNTQRRRRHTCYELDIFFKSRM